MHSSKTPMLQIEDIFGFVVVTAAGGYQIYQSGNAEMLLLAPLGGVLAILAARLLEMVLGPIFIAAFRLLVVYGVVSIALWMLKVFTGVVIDSTVAIGIKLLATAIITALWYSTE